MLTRTRGDEVGIAVLGCGQITRAVHLRVLARLPGARITAIADPDPAALRAAGLLAPSARRFGDAQEAVEQTDVDGVVVAAPSAEHARLAVIVLAAGRHLYLEKPVATSAEDMAPLVRAAEATQLVAAVGLGRRFHPVYARARDLVAAGRLGNVRSVHSAFHEPLPALPPWKRERRTGGGALLDLGSHHADLTEWLLGDVIVSVSAHVGSVRSEGDHASWLLGLRGGAVALGDVSFSGSRTETFEVAGEQGRLRADRYRGTLTLYEGRSRGASVRRRLVSPGRPLVTLRAQQLARPSRDPSFAAALGAWVRAIHGGSRGELPTIEDGLRSLTVVLAAERAAATGTRVRLDAC